MPSDMSIAAQILELAVEKGFSVSSAESCTGGMVAAALTDLPGASVMFDRGFITYSNAAKIDLLGVSQDALTQDGAVSERVAREMAEGARDRSGVTFAISITGIAGPGGSEHKPEGRVCFGLAGPDVLHAETIEFGALGRDAVRKAARDHALTRLLETMRAQVGA
jgi:nicotinamide-nucleotide amidase